MLGKDLIQYIKDCYVLETQIDKEKLEKNIIKQIKNNEAEEFPVFIQYLDKEKSTNGKNFEMIIGEQLKDCYMTLNDFKNIFSNKNPKEIDENFEEGNYGIFYNGKIILIKIFE